jgi:hypothetical protein|tara:strand:- start:53 stop:634 length:582 start_codon:yes stop_codon:yes gene_type:complete
MATHMGNIEMLVISNPHPEIIVYDNVFDWNLNKLLLFNCARAPFSFGWQDSPTEEEVFLHSGITSDMWEHRKSDPRLNELLDPLINSKPFKDVDERKIAKTVVNCDTTNDSHTVHTHQNQDVILYYVNHEWKDGWGGETFFYDKYGKEIIFTSPYTPNRMIRFNGELVHRFNGPSRIGPKFRFSISTFIWKEI